ncbi:MAG: ice-binding family protein [Candidatus Micrarchaeota archaeon]|nr:ice-binding family protein [Candidatus Micrarchaeota archaeon]
MVSYKNIFSLILFIFCLVQTVSAFTSPAIVDLGTAGNFAALAKTGISITGTTQINGNIGVSPIDSTAITGFGLIMDPSNQFSTSSLVNGSVYAADYTSPTPSTMTTAISDMETAYTNAAGRTLPDETELGAGNIGGLVLAPGLYKWGTDVTIPTDVTLSGNSTDVWIFQVAGTLAISSSKQVILSGGAQAKNIFWQVAGQTTLGTTSVFNGNILDQVAIVVNTGATLNGRALAQSAVTLDSNTVSIPVATNSDLLPPVVTLNTANNSWTNNNQTSLNFTFVDAVSTTASCSLFVDNVGRNASLSTTNNIATLITPNVSLSEGAHNWYVNCTDTSSNVGTSTPRVINIDTIAPVVSLVSPVNNTWAAPTFTFNYTDASINSCSLLIGGVSSGTNSSVTNNTNTAISNTSISQGSNSWYVSCTDQASNVGNSSNMIILVDSIYPTSLINNINGLGSGNGTNNNTLTINFTANDTNILNWTLVVYNSTLGMLQNWTATTNNISGVETYVATANGTYYVNLTVLDNASYTNISSFTIYVDQSAPVINSLSTSSVTTSGAILTVNASDAYSGINNCTYSGAGSGSLVLSSGLFTASLSSLSSSTNYVANVTCYDNAGYSASNTTSFTTATVSSSSSSSSSSNGGGWSDTYHYVPSYAPASNQTNQTIQEPPTVVEVVVEKPPVVETVVQNTSEILVVTFSVPYAGFVNSSVAITTSCTDCTIKVTTPYGSAITLATDGSEKTSFIPSFVGSYTVDLLENGTVIKSGAVSVAARDSIKLIPQSVSAQGGFFQWWMLIAIPITLGILSVGLLAYDAGNKKKE